MVFVFFRERQGHESKETKPAAAKFLAKKKKKERRKQRKRRCPASTLVTRFAPSCQQKHSRKHRNRETERERESVDGGYKHTDKHAELGARLWARVLYPRAHKPPGEPRKKIKTVTTRRAPGGLHPGYAPSPTSPPSPVCTGRCGRIFLLVFPTATAFSSAEGRERLSTSSSGTRE